MRDRARTRRRNQKGIEQGAYAAGFETINAVFFTTTTRQKGFVADGKVILPLRENVDIQSTVYV